MSYVRALADGVPSRRLSARLDGTNVTAQAKGQQARSGSRRLPERVGMFLPCSHRSWWNLASSRVGKPRHSIRRGHHVSIGNDWSLPRLAQLRHHSAEHPTSRIYDSQARRARLPKDYSKAYASSSRMATMAWRLDRRC
jgi:hypothetical protein